MQTVLCWLRGYAQEPEGRKVLNTAESIHSRKTLLSRNSKLASPPVLTWLTLSSVFHLAEHVAVSPPPITWSFHLMQEKSVDKMQHAFLKKKKKKKLQKLGRGDILNIIKVICEKLTAHTILSGSSKTESFSSKMKRKDICFSHCYSVLYWKF